MEQNVCSQCGHKFTPASMKLHIKKRENGTIVHRRVCGQCFHKHYAEGEK